MENQDSGRLDKLLEETAPGSGAEWVNIILLVGISGPEKYFHKVPSRPNMTLATWDIDWKSLYKFKTISQGMKACKKKEIIPLVQWL